MSLRRAAYHCCDGLASTSTAGRVAHPVRSPYASSSRHRPAAAPATPLPSGPSPQARSFATTGRARMPRATDHYGSLKLPKNATKQQIKAKFYELSKKTHPDAPGGSADKFHAINEAYEVLGDEAKRRQYDLSLSDPASGPGYAPHPGYTHHPGYPASSSSSYPYSDPFNRRTGPHGAWSTRRPPPRAPPTGFGTYHPFGRHTPHNYGGASSGSYGDPFAAAREQFRQGFADVRSGRSWAGHHHGWPSGSPSGGSPNRRGKGMGGGSSKNAQGGDLGRIIGTFVLVLVVVAFGGTVSTAKAEQPDDRWQQVRRYERERIIRSLGRDEEEDLG